MRARWSATGPQDPVQLQNQKNKQKRVLFIILLLLYVGICIDVSALYVTD